MRRVGCFSRDGREGETAAGGTSRGQRETGVPPLQGLIAQVPGKGPKCPLASWLPVSVARDEITATYRLVLEASAADMSVGTPRADAASRHCGKKGSALSGSCRPVRLLGLRREAPGAEDALPGLPCTVAVVVAGGGHMLGPWLAPPPSPPPRVTFSSWLPPGLPGLRAPLAVSGHVGSPVLSWRPVTALSAVAATPAGAVAFRESSWEGKREEGRLWGQCLVSCFPSGPRPTSEGMALLGGLWEASGLLVWGWFPAHVQRCVVTSCVQAASAGSWFSQHGVPGLLLGLGGQHDHTMTLVWGPATPPFARLPMLLCVVLIGDPDWPLGILPLSHSLAGSRVPAALELPGRGRPGPGGSQGGRWEGQLWDTCF